MCEAKKGKGRDTKIKSSAAQFSEPRAAEVLTACRWSQPHRGKDAGDVEDKRCAEVDRAQHHQLRKERMRRADELRKECGVEDKGGGIAEGDRQSIESGSRGSDRDRIARAGARIADYPDRHPE